jgi:6-phosphofructokinase 1
MKKILVFTSGGDAPGMNACIRAVVRSACHYNMEVIGAIRGLEGIIDGNFVALTTDKVANIIQRGGTILQSSRSQRFRTKEGRKIAYEQLINEGVEGIVCIGGDGSYTACSVFFNEYGIPAIGCPGTIDNDIYGTDYTIGFDTAVNTVIDAVDKIRDTAESHSTVFFVEVMGRHSGQIALYSGIAAGAEAIMIPEKEGELEALISRFSAEDKRDKQFSIILVAEGDEMGSALKIATIFKENLPHVDPKTVVLGHIQRGGAPTVNDRILASKLGFEAVTALRNGTYNMAVGIVNNQTCFTPFELAISKQKQILPNLHTLSAILCS